MCSYYSKGAADYVGVWDFEDFFIPRGANQNVLDVLKAVERSNTDLSISSQGGLTDTKFIDNQSHPFCYLLLATEDTYIDAQPKGQVPKSERIDYELLSLTLAQVMRPPAHRSPASDLFMFYFFFYAI